MKNTNGTNGNGYLRRHGLIKVQQLTRPTIDAIFAAADQVKQGHFDSQALRGKLMVVLFYEPSTRTKFSHEIAMAKLGGTVISTDSARVFSSAAKGETIGDTFEVIGGYEPDIIVVRYDRKGELEEAQRRAGIPVINAGDGTGQHPTQALLDLFTIREKFGEIQGLHIAIGGAPRLLDVDHVIICAGQDSLTELVPQQQDANRSRFHLIGGAALAEELDAKRAIREGAELAVGL